MKKFLLHTSLIIMVGMVSAQNWCPPGAKWHFRRGNPNSISGIDGVIEMAFTATTTILGMPCKRLDATYSGINQWGPPVIVNQPYSTHFTYDNNNVVFLYNGSNAFDTLVNFNASPGDKWLKPRSTQTSCFTRPVCVVTGTTNVTINGFSLKRIAITYTASSPGQNNGTYTYTAVEAFVERIVLYEGINQSLFPTNCVRLDIIAEYPIIDFRCYEDNTFPLYYENDAPFDINSSAWFGCSSLTGVETFESSNITLSLYPNPSNGSFQLDLQQPGDIWIYNMFGETVYYNSFKEKGSRTIEIGNIAPGVYTLEAKTLQGRGTIKLIRQ